jgi:RNA polymerase sigma factor (sigma-70 family)
VSNPTTTETDDERANRTADLELVARLRNGARTAFDEVYTRYKSKIFGFLLRLSGRRHVTADLTQETWLRFARSAPNLAPDTKLNSYLFTIAINVYRSHHRWAMLDFSRILLFGLATRDDHVGYDELAPDHRAGVANIEQALGQLRPADRELLLLIGVHGFEPQEAAQMLGLGQDVLRTRLARARKRLHEAMHTTKALADFAEGNS